MFVSRLRTGAELDQIQADWQRLSGGNPLQSYTWMRSWWDAFGQHRELYVLCFRDSGGLVVGLFPFCRRWSLDKGHCLELLGSGKACSDYQRFLVDPMFADDVLQAAVEWLLAAQGEHRWDTIDLDGVEALDPHINAWRTRMAERAVSITQLEQPSCWRLELPASREAYLSERSKSRRRLLKKQFELLEQPDSPAKYEVAETLDQLRSITETTRQLHQGRWQADGVAGCFADAAFDRFLPEVLERLWPSGSVHAALVTFDGLPVAGSLGLIEAGVHYVYLVGMDPAAAAHQPGWLLNCGHLRHAWEHGLTGLDFLRGDESYKASLGAERRPQMRLRLASRQTLAQVRHRLWHVGRYCRRWQWLKRHPRQTLAPAASCPDTP
ncbi:MAG: GNAT family N-acetyltransferase [Pirellulales bacterium]